jgi:hypothetical protein
MTPSKFKELVADELERRGIDAQVFQEDLLSSKKPILLVCLVHVFSSGEVYGIAVDVSKCSSDESARAEIQKGIKP